MTGVTYKRLEYCDVGNITIEYPQNKLARFLEDETNYLFVGIKDDSAVAFAYGYGLSRPDGRRMFYIHSVDVKQEYQSNGIGTGLMKYILEYIIDEKKYYKFFVLTDPDNIKACKLYQKFASPYEQVLFAEEITQDNIE